MNQQDTICALATPTGGAIAVIRISGNDTIRMVSTIFSKPLQDAKGYTVHYGEIREKEMVVDDVLITLFRAPHSYTGEDSVEISCHGSQYIVRRILDLLVKQGCRMAEPGEYTQRAFLNSKMDLSQAEAVADLIASTNQATHKLALSQLRGSVSSELAKLREQLLHLTTLMELELDFSDHEELEFADRTELLQLAHTVDAHITRLTQTFETGQAIKQGIPVAIVGKTNVGKSTLLNKLLGDDRAIVSEVHGTTRDTIEEVMDINGVAFRIIDTAGLRKTTDVIEQIGIERTRKKIQEARIVVFLFDDAPTDEEQKEIEQIPKDKRVLIVRNKSDLIDASSLVSNQPNVLLISAKEGTNIEVLKQQIYDAANLTSLTYTDVIITSSRHYEALLAAQDNLHHVLKGLQSHLPTDLIAEDLRLTLSSLSEITGGLITSQETLNNIFHHFCVGK
ncbi:MAG: tRNA uridine-5-carboxymethylaminomethyl(34) synthesis GTPase MnmE [Bacteroidaceae bacterium]|nr:tRNA uridine-5-carboxymethylaminomethyl(34) synthesis GTPase MnmE [Bacteroidaceae bacterium]